MHIRLNKSNADYFSWLGLTSAWDVNQWIEDKRKDHTSLLVELELINKKLDTVCSSYATKPKDESTSQLSAKQINWIKKTVDAALATLDEDGYFNSGEATKNVKWMFQWSGLPADFYADFCQGIWDGLEKRWFNLVDYNF